MTTKTSKKTDFKKTLELLVKELISKIGSSAEVKVSEDKENDALVVDLESSSETGLLIGKKGEGLEAIQSLLGMMLRQKTGEWKRVLVNIADWREKQEGYLRSLALQAIERLKETGQPQSIYNLSPSQRKMVHTVVGEVNGFVSESQGEGEERYLVIKRDEPKEG